MSLMDVVEIQPATMIVALGNDLEAAPYASTNTLIDKATEVALANQRLPAQEVAFMAMDIQTRQNVADSDWLQHLPVSSQIRTMIECRLQARGACWLEFVERLVRFEGDYRDHSFRD